MRQRIKNEPNLMRDEKTKVIINTNDADYNLILERRRHKAELESVSSEVNSLKQELDDLKKLIKAISK